MDEMNHENLNETSASPEKSGAPDTVPMGGYGSQTNPIHADPVITDYRPVGYSPVTKRQPASKGIRVFCLIMAAVFLLTGGCAVGYLVGLNRKEIRATSQTELNLAAKPTDTDEYTVAQTYEAVNKSVVGIVAYNDAGTSAVASGVIYTEDGYIITNDHIYENIPSAKFKIHTYDGKELDAAYVAGDTRSDLAVLKIDTTGLYAATFGNSDEVVIGETVCAVGRPNGISENSITKGNVSLKERRVSVTSSYSTKMIQTDAAINPGNSGGALVNMYGQVIGITSSKIAGAQYEGIAFAIPTTTVKRVVESLISNGCVNDRCRLGITYQAVDSVSKEINHLGAVGIRVAGVDDSSDLKGKVAVGDIITHVNGVEISSDSVLLDVIENAKPGDVLEFTVYTEGGSVKTVSAATLSDPGSSSYTDNTTSNPLQIEPLQ